MLDVRPVVVGNEVQVFAKLNDELPDDIFIAAIPLSDSIEIIRQKTQILLDGLKELSLLVSGRCSPKYTIHPCLDKRGNFLDVKLQFHSGKWLWRYIAPAGQHRTKRFDPQTSHADVVYFRDLILRKYNIPDNSITAMTIQALLNSMVRQTY